MVSTRKKKNQHKTQLNQLNETLNDFVIGKDTNACAVRDGALETQTNSPPNNFGRFVVDENVECQNQVIGNRIDDKIKKAVDSDVMAVENRMHDASFTAMNNMVIPRVEMAVRSIIGSSGQGPSSLV